VLLALALGARAVLLGRAVNWGLTVGGEAGVAAVFEILRHELDLAMGLCGVRDVTAVDRRLVECA
jgi:isopentenyl diphosphate isomerase/L-lactate dehydrogenase-like FMN-dependent dehydrogenase